MHRCVSCALGMPMISYESEQRAGVLALVQHDCNHSSPCTPPPSLLLHGVLPIIFEKLLLTSQKYKVQKEE